MILKPLTNKELLKKYNKGLSVLIKHTEKNRKTLSKRQFNDNIELIIHFINQIKKIENEP